MLLLPSIIALFFSVVTLLSLTLIYFDVLLSLSSLCSPPLLPSSLHTSPPTDDSSNVAGCTTAKRQALHDAG